MVLPAWPGLLQLAYPPLGVPFQAGRPFRSKESNKMGYEDFVWFIMSEEDKSSDMALDYWFKCCDLDGDGCLRANEMLVSSGH